MSPLADSHCHLGLVEGGADRALAAAAGAGVELVIDIGMGLAGSRQAAQRAAEQPGCVRASVGLHPNDLSDFAGDPHASMRELADLAGQQCVVGIGETGLDVFRDREPVSRQKEAFAAHIELAKQAGKALVIHCRDAHDTLLEVLTVERPPPTVVMHCFSGDEAFARTCVERGWYCSFAGNITYKRNEELRRAAAVVDEQLLLVETDAPYLSPVPHRGKPNSPALLPLTAAVLADVRGADRDELGAVLWSNTRSAFGL